MRLRKTWTQRTKPRISEFVRGMDRLIKIKKPRQFKEGPKPVVWTAEQRALADEILKRFWEEDRI